MAPQSQEAPSSKSLPDRVAQLYYAYGLFCSSYPGILITFAATVVVICCLPLLSLPLPGNVPQHHVSPADSFHGNSASAAQSPPPPPVWYNQKPLCYIQQIVLKTAVSPWTPDLVLTDAFRGPLSEVFTLVDNIRNYQLEGSSKSLSQVCLHVEAVKSRHVADKRHILPEYNCLILSPANLWHQDRDEFNKDASLLTTVFSYASLQKSKMSLAELLFGLNMKDTGIKRYPLRTRQRTLQYAVTLVFQEYDQMYVDGLRKKLASQYPLHQVVPPGANMLHVYYPGEFHIRQLVPLTAMYMVLFFYVYFSLRKVELVRAKVRMALSAVATALASLLMSAGLCFFFGLTLTLTGREMFPYLVIVVGLENVLVVTKSILSTPAHLDVKIRVAQGLSKEGWSITNNLLTEVTILTFGLLTFVPAIQRFCIFAVVGLLSDFFLQMVFFATVLSIDVTRHDNALYKPVNNSPASSTLHPPPPMLAARGTIHRSKSHPRLNGLTYVRFPTTVVAPLHYTGSVLEKIPKRLRLVHFWARTRFFQRSFMLFMVAWIAVIAYNSEVVENFFQLESTEHSWDKSITPEWDPNQFASRIPIPEPALEQVSTQGRGEEELARLRPNEYEPWLRLSHYHWAAILSFYNVSVVGRYITVLPAIRLAHAVPPANAMALRNPEEKSVGHFQWQTIAAALDPLDFSDRRCNMPKVSSSTTHYKTVYELEFPWVAKCPKSNISAFCSWCKCEINVSGMGKSALISHVKSKKHAAAAENLKKSVPMDVFIKTSTVTASTGSSSAAVHPTDGDVNGPSGIDLTRTRSELPLVPTSPMELFLLALLCIVSVVVLAYCTVLMYRCVCTRNYAEWRAGWLGDSERSVDGGSQVVYEALPLVLEGHPQEIECLASDGSIIASSCLAGHLRVWDATSGECLSVIDRKQYFFQPVSKQRKSQENDELALSDTSGSPPSNADLAGWESASLPHKRHSDVGLSMASGQSSDPQSRRARKNQTLPDLRPFINTKFTGMKVQTRAVNPEKGYDFSSVFRDLDFDQDETGAEENGSEVRERNRFYEPLRTLSLEEGQSGVGWSETNSKYGSGGGGGSSWGSGGANVSPIWCMDCRENLVVIGCANGRLEFWEGSSGVLKCMLDHNHPGGGVTSVKLIGNRVVAARLSGHLDFLVLQSFSRGRQIDWGFTAYRRSHVRSGSTGLLDWDTMVSRGEEEDIRCNRLRTIRAHQQPITVLLSEAGRVMTGSSDHTLKVFRVEDQLALYTLIGHCGPITCSFIDRISPMTAGSASQDGLLCIWDLLSGACMYSIQAHDGAVLALTYSASYVISLGSDERLSVWERFQGHHLITISMTEAYCSNIEMLTHSLLLTSKQGSLIIWDVRTGEPVRVVHLGHSDPFVSVKQMILLNGSVVCDYGNQLRLVRLPLASDKSE